MNCPNCKHRLKKSACFASQLVCPICHLYWTLEDEKLVSWDKSAYMVSKKKKGKVKV